MARTAALNSSATKARGSITHLFVFLQRWITVSVADSSLEWNENKAIIQRVRACRKGRKGHAAVQEFRLTSVLSLVHLRPLSTTQPTALWFHTDASALAGSPRPSSIRGQGEPRGHPFSPCCSPCPVAALSDPICSWAQSGGSCQAGWAWGTAQLVTWGRASGWALGGEGACTRLGRLQHLCKHHRASLGRIRATAAFWGFFALSWDVSELKM